MQNISISPKTGVRSPIHPYTIYNHRPTGGSTLLIFGKCLPRCRSLSSLCNSSDTASCNAGLGDMSKVAEWISIEEVSENMALLKIPPSFMAISEGKMDENGHSNPQLLWLAASSARGNLAGAGSGAGAGVGGTSGSLGPAEPTIDRGQELQHLCGVHVFCQAEG